MEYLQDYAVLIDFHWLGLSPRGGGLGLMFAGYVPLAP